MKHLGKYIALALMAFAVGCDVVDGPYSEKPQGGGNGGGGNFDTIRKVLVEDYTGHKCGNCPRASEAIKNLEVAYGEQIVPLAIHVGFFAQPSSSGSFTYDFRSDVGNELSSTFGNDAAGLPNGNVNRKNNAAPVSYTAWATDVAGYLASAPDALIKIASTFNTSNRQATATVNTAVLNALGGDYNLSVYLVEDSIINWQKDYSLNPQNIPDYAHRHVLRGSFNGTWGSALATGGLQAGATSENTYNLTLPAEWNADKCYIVSFIYNTATREVVQAEQRKLNQQ